MDDERLLELLRMLPPPPEAWVASARDVFASGGSPGEGAFGDERGEPEGRAGTEDPLLGSSDSPDPFQPADARGVEESGPWDEPGGEL